MAVVVVVAGGMTLGARPAHAAAPPHLHLSNGIEGIPRPTHITNADDGSGRLFVTEEQGRVRIIRNGALDPQPFLEHRLG